MKFKNIFLGSLLICISFINLNCVSDSATVTYSTRPVYVEPYYPPYWNDPIIIHRYNFNPIIVNPPYRYRYYQNYRPVPNHYNCPSPRRHPVPYHH